MRTQVSDASRFQIPRREFLRLGSTAAVGVAATSLSGGSITAPMPLLSIGFCEQTLDEIAAGDARCVVAAQRLGSADRQLAANGVMVTVHGFQRAAAHDAQPLAISLRAYYPSVDPATGAKTPFIAWVWGGNARHHIASNRTAFTVPVANGDALHLGIDRTIEVAAQSTILRRLTGVGAKRRDDRAEIAAFAPRGGSDALPLRRGTWFLAVRESDGDAAPSWSSLHAIRAGNELILRDIAGGEPNFSYLVISTDAAKV